jgi:hypothetical protein
VNAGIRRDVLVLGLVALACCLGAAPALAAPPANDAFEDAQPVDSALPASAAGDNEDSTAETEEPAHGEGPAAQSVWFSWEAPSSGPVKLDACPVLDPSFAVYTGDAVDDLTPVVTYIQAACSRVFEAEEGVTYMIAFDSPIVAGEFEFVIRQAQPPANDDFEDAEELPAYGSLQFDADNVDSNEEPDEPGHNTDAPARKSVWYRWTSPVDTEVIFSACDGEFLPRIEVYTGTAFADLDPLSPITGGICSMEIEAEAGLTYHVVVDALSHGMDGDEGAFTFRRNGPIPPPPNDDLAAAQPIGGLPASVEGDNISATSETNEPFHFLGVEPFYSVWYAWTAPSSGPIEVDTCDSDFDPLVAVYGGTGGFNTGLVQLASNDDGAACANGNPFGSAVPLTVAAGTVYRIAVDGYDQGTFALHIRATGPHAVPVTPPRKCPKGKKLKRGKCVKTKKKKKRKRSQKQR